MFIKCDSSDCNCQDACDCTKASHCTQIRSGLKRRSKICIAASDKTFASQRSTTLLTGLLNQRLNQKLKWRARSRLRLPSTRPREPRARLPIPRSKQQTMVSPFPTCTSVRCNTFRLCDSLRLPRHTHTRPSGAFHTANNGLVVSGVLVAWPNTQISDVHQRVVIIQDHTRYANALNRKHNPHSRVYTRWL
jgi:hypothetical protein